ncbi:GAF domain-containing protein [Actinomadura sp. HBU206391]|uniref:GAF domain-containing protein n=1 Tax=Actinomadura sp. HBU206391 TaxID=2731692 RepID=UPI00164FE232|nr:GAF domain-containing protein [Actinomadura sp. HBU206391]MBC6460120.1 HAMP domain-containing protein [Actinomadura sp. HBU206391]
MSGSTRHVVFAGCLLALSISALFMTLLVPIAQMREDAARGERAIEIAQATESLLREHPAPPADEARRGLSGAGPMLMVWTGGEGRDTGASQGRLDRVVAAERAVATADERTAVAEAGWVTHAVLGGLAVSAVLIALFSGYLVRTVTLPVRRAAGMCDRLADGDLSVRVPENATGEIRELQRAFNAMAASLERRNEERVALRRVAVIAAHSAPPLVICNAVTEELCRVLDIDGARMFRYDPDGLATVVATRSTVEGEMLVGSRWPIDGDNIAAMVARSGEPVRLDDYTGASGPIAAFLRDHGIGSAVGAPIVVDDRLWGVLVGFREAGKPLARETEARISELTELVATVIANAQARADLTASRARLVAAADQARIRIERDLHDGVQQRLVSLALSLRAAEESVPAALPDLRTQLSAVTNGLAGTLSDLREASRGIHPAILSGGGLGPAIKALARRSTVPVELRLRIRTRPCESIEVAAYYVVAEALANAAKHAKASIVHVEAEVRDDWLHLLVWDDGVGGADLARGSGLIGLIDRVEAAGGTMKVTSHVNQGTSLQVSLPCRPIPGALI